MTPPQSQSIILAQAWGYKRLVGDSGYVWWKKGTDPYITTDELEEKLNSIDSVRSVVMMQSPEWQKEFSYALATKSQDKGEPYVRGFIKLTPDDWASAAVETAEKMKK